MQSNEHCRSSAHRCTFDTEEHARRCALAQRVQATPRPPMLHHESIFMGPTYSRVVRLRKNRLAASEATHAIHMILSRSGIAVEGPGAGVGTALKTFSGRGDGVTANGTLRKDSSQPGVSHSVSPFGTALTPPCGESSPRDDATGDTQVSCDAIDPLLAKRQALWLTFLQVARFTAMQTMLSETTSMFVLRRLFGPMVRLAVMRMRQRVREKLVAETFAHGMSSITSDQLRLSPAFVAFPEALLTEAVGQFRPAAATPWSFIVPPNSLEPVIGILDSGLVELCVTDPTKEVENIRVLSVVGKGCVFGELPAMIAAAAAIRPAAAARWPSLAVPVEGVGSGGGGGDGDGTTAAVSLPKNVFGGSTSALLVSGVAKSNNGSPACYRVGRVRALFWCLASRAYTSLVQKLDEGALCRHHAQLLALRQQMLPKLYPVSESALRNCGRNRLFISWSDAELRELIHHLRPSSYHAGDVIFHEAVQPDAFIFVASGLVSIVDLALTEEEEETHQNLEQLENDAPTRRQSTAASVGNGNVENTAAPPAIRSSDPRVPLVLPSITKASNVAGAARVSAQPIEVPQCLSLRSTVIHGKRNSKSMRSPPSARLRSIVVVEPPKVANRVERDPLKGFDALLGIASTGPSAGGGCSADTLTASALAVAAPPKSSPVAAPPPRPPASSAETTTQATLLPLTATFLPRRPLTTTTIAVGTAPLRRRTLSTVAARQAAKRAAPKTLGLLATVGPWSAVGEESLITNDKRVASVIARTDVDCWMCSKEAFIELLSSNAKLFLAVKASVADVKAKRLRNTGRTPLEFLVKDSLLQGLPESTLVAIAKAAVPMWFGRRDTLTRVHGPAAIFILLTGTARMTVTNFHRDIPDVPRTYRCGTVMGTAAALVGDPWPYAFVVEASTSCEGWEIDSSALHAAVAATAQDGMELLERLQASALKALKATPFTVVA